MVRIWVIGATGFAGRPVARALRAQGHHVRCWAPTAQKAFALAKEEIGTFIGDGSDVERWTADLEQTNCNIVIDCSLVHLRASENMKICAGISKKRMAKTGHGGKAVKMGYMYLSGTWVFGDAPKICVDETKPVGPNAYPKPAELVAWRVDMENQLMGHSDVLNGLVIRPGNLFGGSANIIGQVWWDPIREAAIKGKVHVELPGNANAMISLVHKEDLAAMVVKAVDKIEILATISYPIFTAVACCENVGQINESAAEYFSMATDTSIKPKITYRKPSTPLEKAICGNGHVACDRSKELLGWTPKHVSLLKDMEMYAPAFSVQLLPDQSSQAATAFDFARALANGGPIGLMG